MKAYARTGESGNPVGLGGLDLSNLKGDLRYAKRATDIWNKAYKSTNHKHPLTIFFGRSDSLTRLVSFMYSQGHKPTEVFSHKKLKNSHELSNSEFIYRSAKNKFYAKKL